MPRKTILDIIHAKLPMKESFVVNAVDIIPRERHELLFSAFAGFEITDNGYKDIALEIIENAIVEELNQFNYTKDKDYALNFYYVKAHYMGFQMYSYNSCAIITFGREALEHLKKEKLKNIELWNNIKQLESIREIHSINAVFAE